MKLKYVLMARQQLISGDLAIPDSRDSSALCRQQHARPKYADAWEMMALAREGSDSGMPRTMIRCQPLSDARAEPNLAILLH